MPDDFHDAFAAAVSGDDLSLVPWWQDTDTGLAALSIYRNTVFKGLADSLIATFPAVRAATGEAWLSAAAVAFARQYPPHSPVLLGYGEDFPGWLRDFAPAADMPWLADVARLDWLWREAHAAADSTAAPADAFTSLLPEDFTRLNAPLRPDVRLAAFDTGIPHLWQALRAGAAAADLTPEPQSIVLWRPDGEVRSEITSPTMHAFLTACQSGASLADGAGHALAVEPDADLSALFSHLIAARLFAAPQPTRGIT